MCGTLWHILASGIPAAAHFSQHVQESSKCYRPNLRKVTPGSYALHNLVNDTFHHTFHTYTRSTCKFWWDSGAPEAVPSPPKKGGPWAPDGLPP